MIQLTTINYLLETKDSSFITLNNFSDDYFCDYKKEYQFIKEHYNSYGVIPDKTTFLEKFPNFTLLDVNESPKYLIDALIEDRNKRKLINTFNEIAKCINANDIDGAMFAYKKSNDEILEEHRLDCVDITKDTSRYDRYIEKCDDFNRYYVTTGFKELDDIFGGWDRQEELATIIARTNQGKSWLLLKSAIAAAEQGLNVGIYSGEMSEDKVGYRLDTLLGHISNNGIIHGDIKIQNSYKTYIDNLPTKIKGSIKVLTPSMAGGLVGVGALRAFIEKEHLDMLCIDQHSLLEDDRKAKNPVERASNISKDLKNLQVMKKIPIITVSQQNRTSTENGIDSTHIAQSDRIGQDSTIILGFEQKDGVLKLQIIKSRDSGAGKKLEYAINFDKGEFVYMPSDDDAIGGVGSEEMYEEFDGNGEDVF